MDTRFVFVTGGVVSSLGKGIAVSSFAALMESQGYRVAILKLDPYLNVDPGTMSPYQHGEVYVTDDGSETDLDLGHYYRFSNTPLSHLSTVTSGKIYETVLRNERKGLYLGQTVQVIPHITDEIKRRIHLAANQEEGIDILFVEVGGTVGDIESLPFLEAIRQMRLEKQGLSLSIHLSYVPYVKAAGELKSKPTQHSCQTLRQAGIFPEMICCRCENPLPQELIEKLAMFCSVSAEYVVSLPDARSVYQIPLMMQEAGLDKKLTQLLKLEYLPCDLSSWCAVKEALENPLRSVKIGVVGKYLDHNDAYKSVMEALLHGGIPSKTHVQVIAIDSENLCDADLLEVDGVLVPGGFGERGWEGKLRSARICREKKIPFFGICLGMQVMAVEFARNVLGISNANSLEMDPDATDSVISLLEDQYAVADKGGTMRLGAYPCSLLKGSLAEKVYGKSTLFERHRHRYEFNNAYRSLYESNGLVISGTYDKQCLAEIMEIPSHPFMLSVQFHPEFQSKPTQPHPLFRAFVEAAAQER